MKHISTYLKKYLVLTSLFVFILFHETSAAQEPSPSSLIIESRGELTFVIKHPDGILSGVKALDVYEDHSEIQDLSLKSGYQALRLSNPSSGTYEIEFNYRFNNTRSGEIIFTYIDQANDIFFSREFIVIAQPNKTQKLVFTVNDEDQAGISFEDNLHTPDDIRLTKTELGYTKISWDPGTEHQNSKTYKVWKKQENVDLDYQLINETPVNSYLTAIPWGPERINQYVFSDHTKFALSVEDQEGNQSYLSNPLLNNDIDADGFSDSWEIDIGTNPENPDTDQDGLDDFIEINRYYTDPNTFDSDEDGYGDGVEIEKGSHPLDKDSIPTDNCTPPLENGPWLISQDCEQTTDLSLDHDIIISNQSQLTLAEYITLGFDFIKNKILFFPGASLILKEGARVKQK